MAIEAILEVVAVLVVDNYATYKKLQRLHK
jgi:hypothetical protein